MKKIILYILLLIFGLTGCASTTNSFKQAQGKNTVKAHEELIRQHPNSEYTSVAKKEIVRLQQKEKEKYEQAKQSLLEAIPKIEGYSIGVTTEKQFFEDGWNAMDPIYGKLGIVGFECDPKTIYFYLGNVTTEPSAEAIQGSLKFRFASIKSGIPHYNSSLPPIQAQVVCVLKFEDGIFRAVKWAKSFQK